MRGTNGVDNIMGLGGLDQITGMKGDDILDGGEGRDHYHYNRGDGADTRAASITIEDTGIGIAEPDLDRIFDEFEQVKPSARGDSISRGTGLGLTVSRKLARLIGGDVRVESHLGAGSRFTLTVPFEPGPEVAALAHERSGTAFHERRGRESETGGSPRPEGAEPPVEAGPRP